MKTTYAQFIREFAPILQVFGKDPYPTVVLELMHSKVKDLDGNQCRALIKLILEMSTYAPKVPDVIECANIIRARHREGIRGDGASEPGPRTPEVGRQALATITNILAKKGP